MNAPWGLMTASLLIPAAFLLGVRFSRFWQAAVLWLCWPALIFFCTIVWEIFTRAPVPDLARTAFLAFSLISAIIILPWLLISAVVLSLAVGMRLIFRRSAPVPVAGTIVEPVEALPSHVAGPEPQSEPGIVDGLCHTSPDGRVQVILDPIEWSNTHWVNPPRVIDMISGEIVLDLWQTDWDAGVGFPGPHQVLLRCRRYQFGGGLTVVLNLAEGTYQILNVQNVGGPLPSAPLNQIAQGLDEASQCSAAATPGRAAPDITTAPSWRNWAKAIATVVGVLMVSGLTAVLTGGKGVGESTPAIVVPLGGFKPYDSNLGR